MHDEITETRNEMISIVQNQYHQQQISIDQLHTHTIENQQETQTLLDDFIHARTNPRLITTWIRARKIQTEKVIIPDTFKMSEILQIISPSFERMRRDCRHWFKVDMEGTIKGTIKQWTVKQTGNISKYFLNDLIPQIKSMIEDVYKVQDKQKTKLHKLLGEKERLIEQKSFKVAVISPIKCGKSTFLNCILQASILSEDTLPKTAALMSIVHCANLAIPQLYSVNEKGLQNDYLAEGEQDIHNYLADFNTYVREFNENPSTPNPRGFPDCRQLLLKAHIPALNHFNSDSFTFSLIDIPDFINSTVPPSDC